MRQTLSWLIVILLAALVAALYVLPVQALFVHVPRNYNEGWNAFHTLRLRTGGPLYPPLSEAVFINYPPLSFYVVAALHPLFGDDIFAGRALALLSEIVVAVNLALIARSLRVNWPLAVVTALLFLAFAAIFYEDAVAIDDPQWLGHALQSSALVFLLRLERQTWRTLVITALLCLAGGLAKQSLVVVPLALTGWLAFEDRRAFIRWCAICAGLVVLTLAVLTAAYGADFVDQVLLSQRSLWSNGLALLTDYLGIWLTPYTLFAVAGVILFRADHRARLIGIYLVIGLIVGVALLTIDGVGYSALFDFTVAAMVGAALLFERLSERFAPRSTARAAILLVPALPMLILGPNALSPQADLQADLAHSADWRKSIDRLAATQGDVACEMLSLCYWAGKSSAFEFFNFGQYAKLHPAFAGSVLDRIRSGDLALIQEDGAAGSQRLPPGVNATIAQRYATVQTMTTTLLAPR